MEEIKHDNTICDKISTLGNARLIASAPDLLQQVASLTEENQQLKNKGSEISSKAEALQDEVNASFNIIAELREENERLQQKEGAALGSLGRAEKKFKEMQGQISHLTEENARLNDDCNKLIAGNAELREENERLKKENIELRASYGFTVLQNQKQQIMQLREALEDVHREIENLDASDENNITRDTRHKIKLALSSLPSEPKDTNP